MITRAQLAALLAAIALGALAAWWWFDTFEERLVARYDVSDAARDNPMLAATLLLQQERHPVTLAATLSELDPARLADGTLLLAEPQGLLTEAQAAGLLAWIRRGNTLVTRPRWISGAEHAVAPAIKRAPAAAPKPGDGDEDEDAPAARTAPAPAAPATPATPASTVPRTPPTVPRAAWNKDDAPSAARVEFDPLAIRLGVRSTDAQSQTTRCAPSAPAVPLAPAQEGKPRLVIPHWRSLRLACLTLPGNGHLVELNTDGTVLVSLRGAAQPELADPKGEALRVYAEGKGHIVMLASNYFNNAALQHFDHAELLLFLTRLNPDKRTVTIVQRLDIVRWYRALWQRYPLALGSGALALLLLLWSATRRFGPMLPAPQPERRALVEHLDASGAWLWKLPGGRRLLLDAVRSGVNALLVRRVHALRTLGPAEQCALLARTTALPAAALDAALFEPPALLPRDFTRQIRTLVQLRNHYER